MLNKRMIKKLTNTSTYNKGLDLYYLDKVNKFTVDDHDLENIVINARVKGSGSKSYDVELVYDELADDVTESYCECPAFYSYTGLCKHCIAVLLEYENYPERQP